MHHAAKISKKKIFKEEEKNTNIYREAQLISQLNHPCILKFIGYSPLDFDNNKKPVILTEYNSNGSLRNLLDLDRQEVEIDEFDCTRKLMIIYGIASCMPYLHSKGLIHRDLKPENFLLDQLLLPKLANFCYTKNINLNMSKSGNEMIGLPKYFSPEIFEREEYSKASDVYAFSLILYEIETGIKPFSGKAIYQIMTEVKQGNRPSFDESIPDRPSKRPSFDQITKELITNEEFVNDDVEKEVFQQYVKYINEYVAKFEESHEIIQFEDHLSIEKVDLVAIRKEHFKYRRIDSVYQIPNLSFYSKKMKIGEGSFGVIYEVSENSKDCILAAKISKKQLYEMDDDEFLNLQREIEIISQLNNLCILKFHAFSPINFNDENYPVVITEFVPKGSLQDALNKEKNGLSDPNWDATTKMINIYGIAFGMSYLHHQDIIHRDLKPDNVLLDELLYPKIADFGLSKKLSNENKEEEQPSAYKLKGTPLYCSPEILTSLNYTKAGDVYAYSFIVYEIVTTETPFQNVNSFTLLKKIIDKERPSFDSSIPACYRTLIEKCWSQNPEDRPSFDEILDDLENNPDFLLEGADEDRYLDYIEDLNENARFRKDKINQTMQIEEIEKLSEKSGIINKVSDSKRYNSQDELKNDQELLTDEVQDDICNEKMIKRSTDPQTDIKIDEIGDNANNDIKMNKSGDVKIFEEIENDNSEDTTAIDIDTANAAESMRSGLDSVEESPVKIIEDTEEVEHANCAEPGEESFVDEQNDGDGSNLLQDRSASIEEEQPDVNAAVHESELVQQQNEHENNSKQAK